MHYHGVTIPKETIADFCRRHRIRRLSLFGSILREDFGAESDVDVLVEFETGKVPSLLGMAGWRSNCPKCSGGGWICEPRRT